MNDTSQYVCIRVVAPLILLFDTPYIKTVKNDQKGTMVIVCLLVYIALS